MEYRIFTCKSNTHRAVVSDDGILDVFPINRREIEEVSFENDSVSVVVHTMDSSEDVVFRRVLSAMESFPVFRAAQYSNSMFHVDYEYGMSRWHGKRRVSDVTRALNRCNFSTKDIEKIIDLCKSTSHPFLPRVG